jgi:hypothetical protein
MAPASVPPPSSAPEEVQTGGPGLAPEGVRSGGPDPVPEGIRPEGPELAPEGVRPSGSAPEAGSQGSEDVPRDVETPTAAAGETLAAMALPGPQADLPASGPAERAARAVAADAEDLEAPESIPQPAQEDEPEVVLGGRFLPRPAEVPLSRLIVKAQQASEELEEGFRRAWEKLEAERLRLADWEDRLGERIAAESSHHAAERARLEREREALGEDILKAAERERKVAQREALVLRKQIQAEEKARDAEEKAKAAQALTDQAKKVVKEVAEKEERLLQAEIELAKQQLALGDRELAAGRENQRLASRAVELEVRAEEVAEQEEALKEREAAIAVERDSAIRRVARWVEEVNPTLDTLGLPQIRAAEAPSTLDAALQPLDSANEQLQELVAIVADRLESEGLAVARVAAEHVLTCFRSHDPAASLSPVLLGPLQETAAAAQEGVQEAVDIVVSRLERHPSPGPADEGDTTGAPEE